MGETPGPIDPEVAEDYAEAVGPDPSPDQIDTYLALEGQPPLAQQVSAVDGTDPDKDREASPA